MESLGRKRKKESNFQNITQEAQKKIAQVIFWVIAVSALGAEPVTCRQPNQAPYTDRRPMLR